MVADTAAGDGGSGDGDSGDGEAPGPTSGAERDSFSSSDSQSESDGRCVCGDYSVLI